MAEPLCLQHTPPPPASLSTFLNGLFTYFVFAECNNTWWATCLQENLTLVTAPGGRLVDILHPDHPYFSILWKGFVVLNSFPKSWWKQPSVHLWSRASELFLGSCCFHSFCFGIFISFNIQRFFFPPCLLNDQRGIVSVADTEFYRHGILRTTRAANVFVNRHATKEGCRERQTHPQKSVPQESTWLSTYAPGDFTNGVPTLAVPWDWNKQPQARSAPDSLSIPADETFAVWDFLSLQ